LKIDLDFIVIIDLFGYDVNDKHLPYSSYYCW